MYTFFDWYKTAWDKINVDTLVEETKKLAKEVKTLNKAVSHVCTTCVDGSGVEPLLPAAGPRQGMPIVPFS